MKLVHIYIEAHKSVRNLNVSLGGNVRCIVDDHGISIDSRGDTSGYYNGFHCSAIIGVNGVGKSSILDFLEAAYFPTDSSGVLVFQDSDLKNHICEINYRIKRVPLPCEVWDEFEVFARRFGIALVKINNVSVAQSRFGYLKKSKHPLVQERSLERYAATKITRKRYFDNLLRYLRWEQSGRDLVGDVGFEFAIENSLWRIPKLIPEKVLTPEHQQEFDSAYESLMVERRPSSADAVELYGHVVSLLSVSLLVELASLAGVHKRKVLIALIFYFVRSLRYHPYMDFLEGIFKALESLRYDENWDIFDRTLGGKSDLHFDSYNVDVSRMASYLQDYFEVLNDIANHLSDGRLSRGPNETLIVMIDDFALANKIVHLASRLPRSVGSNISWGWRGVSTGEMARTHIFSETYNFLSAAKPGNYLILIDEADLYLHPEWQRSFLDSYLELLQFLASPKVKPQLLITTHSPIIVSDFLPEDIVSLTKTNDGRILVKESFGFGTNITNLFIEGMHLSSTVGEHARKAIITLIEKSHSHELNDLDRELISRMGSKFVREYLLRDD